MSEPEDMQALQRMADLLDDEADINAYDALDEMIHDIKDLEASNLNNLGTLAQLMYPYQQSGCTIPGLLKTLSGKIEVK